MRLELGKVVTQPGEVQFFSQEMDFSEMTFGCSCPVEESVSTSGQIRNEAGVLRLTARLNTVLHCICDRCASSYKSFFSLDAEAILVQELMDEDNEDEAVFVLQDNTVDLDEVMTTMFVLNMDSKFLCSPDCKGLCSQCGKNLNEGECDCKSEPDPRLAVLRQLLDNQL